MNFELNNRIKMLNKYSNLDALYGPYENKESACQAVPKELRGLGLTVGIIENDLIVEYLWKKGTEDEFLIPKIEEYSLNIKNISYSADTENNTITFNIEVQGKGFGVSTNIYLGSNRITSVSTLLNLVLHITIQAPENPGNYTYSVSVIDNILNNGVLKECEVIWKEVDVKIDLASPIFNFLVKSFLNLQNSSFTFLVYKIDSVVISGIYILYGENSKVIYTPDIPYSNTYTILLSELIGLKSGDLILVRVDGNISEPFDKEVVLLTAPGVFSAFEGIIPTLVYNGLSFSSTLKFEAENIANYLVVIKDNDLDIVYNSSLLSYSVNTLTISLNDPTLSESNPKTRHTLGIYIDNKKVWEYPTITLIYVPNNELLKDIDTYTKFKDSFDFGLGELESITIQSYILDLICYIPYTEDSRILFLFGNITINKDFIQFGSIKYPTPILLNISIGFMCNIKSSYLNHDYYYNALFINGVLCTKSPDAKSPLLVITSESLFIDEISISTYSTYIIDGIEKNIYDGIRLYFNTQNAILLSPEQFVLERNYKSRNPGSEPDNLPIFSLTPINNIKTKADIPKSLWDLIINNKITIDGIEYDVINTTSYRVGTFGNLGDEKYIISDILNSFCESYGIPQSGTESEIIDLLKKLVKKDPSKIPNNYLTLTRQIVKSKLLLQKYVAVPCLWSYNGKEGYTLVYTLGTSTLEYALPNFTFKFFTDKSFETKSNVQIVPKIERTLYNLLTYSNEITDDTTYFSENELVAKVDYMESPHLNNTPTAMFYNAITTLQNGYDVIGSDGSTIQILKNPVGNKLNAIEGIPIVIDINGINYGSFMLNIGKAGKSIGFGSNGISLEGTSNADNSEMSSRFDFATTDTKALEYFNSIEDIESVTSPNKDFVKFLQGGLEYRYSENDLEDIGDNEGTEENPEYSEYLRILKMWHWIYTHEKYTKQEFESMFNFDFFALYYIQMMIFGQTDNLGKNCMFDQFEENGLWYVRPYDMDSLGGIENNGNDSLSPVIEISQKFVLDEATKDINSVEYLGDPSPRFPFSSKTSNLWIRFYNNLRSDIEIFYRYLRDLGYSSEAVISLCEKEVISKLGISQYNKDFLNKYLSNEDSTQQFAFGNRWFRFKDWIQKRFDFCDTYFKYNIYNANTSGDGINYKIKFSLPLYLLYSYNNLGSTVTFTSWGLESNLQFHSITKQNMYFSPKYITDDSGIFLSGFTTLSPRVKLNNLTVYSGTWNNLINVVDLSENTYLLEMTISNINTLSDKATIPESVVSLYINNSSLIPELSGFSNLKYVYFSNCEGNISLSNCPNLKTISISSCKNVNLTLLGCGNSNNYIDLNISSSIFNLIIFNGSYIKYLGLPNLTFNISFTGLKSYFKVVNLYYSNILNGELDISNLITDTLILNYISTVKIITSENKSYKFLGLLGANITLWGNTSNTFNGNYFNNINDIRMIESINDSVINSLLNNTYSSSIPFRLKGCVQLQHVTNLNTSSISNLMFYNCKTLKTITNSNITASGYYMFYHCYLLNTLPKNSQGKSTITLSTNDGTAMFHSCYKLDYDEIEKVLDNNMITQYWNPTLKQYLTENTENTPVTACKLTIYSSFLYNKTYLRDTTIDLSKYAFGVNMSYCFSITHWGGEETTDRNNTEDENITYIGKLPKCATNIQNIFSSDIHHKCEVDSDLLEECSLVSNMLGAFSRLSFPDSFFVVPKIPNNPNLNLTYIFLGSRIDLSNLYDENGDLYMPSNTVLCSCGFGYAVLKDPLNVSNIFSECTVLNNLTSCFSNCTNITCEEPLQLGTGGPVNVAGIFANNPNKTITFGFDGVWYSDPDAANYNYNYSTLTNSNRYGPYYNTNIKINQESINITNNIYSMKSIFDHATIDNSLGPLNLLLSINTKNCNKICLNISVKDSDILNKVILTVTLNNIEEANYAFYNTKILDTSNSIEVPETLINGSYMFAATNIERLPTGLDLCTKLSDISYMFYNCTDLSDIIPTDKDYFLPISISNISHLFDGCYKLYGGIPKNFIQTITTTEEVTKIIINDLGEEEQITEELEVVIKNNLSSLVCTFANTAILKSNKAFNSENDNIYGELNILEIFPKVTNVEGLFYYMCSANSSLPYILKINSTCFSKCTKCDDLFNSAIIYLPNSCDFSSATSLRFTFATGLSGNRNITGIRLGNRIIDMTGIFSGANTSYINSEIRDNIETFLGMKKGTYTGMLYGYSNDMTKDEYKYVSPSRSIRMSLHS